MSYPLWVIQRVNPKNFALHSVVMKTKLLIIQRIIAVSSTTPNQDHNTKERILTVKKSTREPSYTEFIIIISMMMSLVALSIDAMLPALPQIGADLNVTTANDRQMVISMIFLGISIGQLIFGPLSDSIGRKRAIYLGYGLFIVGALLSAFAASFPIMLAGRLLQGMGVSAPRSVTLALVRDRFEGRQMAQVMSFVMTVFILVPMIAPSLGQSILLLSNWRSIFLAFILVALITMGWFALRIPETLPLEKRHPFSFRRLLNMLLEIIRNRTALGYTIIAGLISGAHLGYLNSAQQIFQEQYGLGKLFPLYFAMIAFSIGLASFVNARLVIRVGMRTLVWRSLLVLFLFSLAGIGISLATSGHPPLWLLIVILMLVFFCIGVLFGNNNSLAMQPLGHVAGLGAAVVGSLSTLLSTPLGAVIGRFYNGTITPLMIGITILTALSIIVVKWVENHPGK
jgi:MFS transporter, DHA1 family, multidrug resistance protein